MSTLLEKIKITKINSNQKYPLVKEIKEKNMVLDQQKGMTVMKTN